MSRIPPHDAHARNVLGMGFLAAKKAVSESLRPEGLFGVGFLALASWQPRRLCLEVCVQKLIKYSQPSLREVISYVWIVWFQNSAEIGRIRPNLVQMNTHIDWPKNNMSWIPPHDAHAKNVHNDWPKITVQEGLFWVGFLAWVSWQPRRLCQEVCVQKLIKYSQPSLREVISYVWIVWFQNSAEIGRIRPNLVQTSTHIDWPNITCQEFHPMMPTPGMFLAWASWQPRRLCQKVCVQKGFLGWASWRWLLGSQEGCVWKSASRS